MCTVASVLFYLNNCGWQSYGAACPAPLLRCYWRQKKTAEGGTTALYRPYRKILRRHWLSKWSSNAMIVIKVVYLPCAMISTHPLSISVRHLFIRSDGCFQFTPLPKICLVARESRLRSLWNSFTVDVSYNNQMDLTKQKNRWWKWERRKKQLLCASRM